MDLSYYAVVTLAWTLGGLVSGTAGMGSSLIALPLLNLVMGPDMAIMNCCIVGGIVPLLIFAMHWQGTRGKELVLLLLASLPGCMVGVLIFEYISLAWLSVVLGLVVSLFVFWQLFSHNFTYRIQNDNAKMALLFGFLAGTSHTLTGVPGTVTGVYATLRTWNKENILAMQSGYFIVASLMTCLIQWSRGLYTEQLMWSVACSLPGMALGLLISIPVQKLVSQELCRKMLLVVLSFSAVMLFVRGVNMI